MTWLRRMAPLGLIAVGIVLLAMPPSIEGPLLLPIGPGHGLSVLDTIGLVPLLIGAGWLEWTIWRRRGRLLRLAAERPAGALGTVLLFGLGWGSWSPQCSPPSSTGGPWGRSLRASR